MNEPSNSARSPSPEPQSDWTAQRESQRTAMPQIPIEVAQSHQIAGNNTSELQPLLLPFEHATSAGASRSPKDELFKDFKAKMRDFKNKASATGKDLFRRKDSATYLPTNIPMAPPTLPPTVPPPVSVSSSALDTMPPMPAEKFTTWHHPHNWVTPPDTLLQDCFNKEFIAVVRRAIRTTDLKSTCFCGLVIHEVEKFISPATIESCPESVEKFREVLEYFFSGKAVDAIFHVIWEEATEFGYQFAKRRYVLNRPMTMWVSHFTEAMIELSEMPTPELLGIPDPDAAQRITSVSRVVNHVGADFTPGIDDLKNLEIRMASIGPGFLGAVRTQKDDAETEDMQGQQESLPISVDQPLKSCKPLHISDPPPEQLQTQTSNTASSYPQPHPARPAPPHLDPTSVQGKVNHELAILKQRRSELDAKIASLKSEGSIPDKKIASHGQRSAICRTIEVAQEGGPVLRSDEQLDMGQQLDQLPPRRLRRRDRVRGWFRRVGLRIDDRVRQGRVRSDTLNAYPLMM